MSIILNIIIIYIEEILAKIGIMEIKPIIILSLAIMCMANVCVCVNYNVRMAKFENIPINFRHVPSTAK